MIKLFSLIFSTFSPSKFSLTLTMMPSNHLLKTNYVFPHEWLVLYILLLLTHFVSRFITAQNVIEEPQCTCFKLLKICALAAFGLAAREAYNTHMKCWRNRNLQKRTFFYTTHC